jgi:tape measure domain-containing protein
MAIRIDTVSDSAKARADLSKLNASVREIENTAKNASSSVSNLFKNLTIGLGSIATVTAVTRFSDDMTNLSNKVRAVTSSNAAFVEGLENIKRVAMGTRTDLGAVSTLYSKVALATKRFGVEQRNVARFTDVVTKSFQLGGATVSEMNAAVLQLGQGLAKGRFDGDELRTVLESAPVFADKLAAALNTNVGKLRDMGAAGELTLDRVFGGMLSKADEIDAEFSRLGVTFGGAFTNLGTSIRILIDNIGKMIFTSEKGLADFINSIAKGIYEVATNLNYYFVVAKTKFNLFIFEIIGFIDVLTKKLSLLPAVFMFIVASVERGVKSVSGLLNFTNVSKGISSFLSQIKSAVEYVKSLFSRVRGINLNTIFPDVSNIVNTVRNVTRQISDAFWWLFDDVIGNSSVPDLVNGVISWFSKLLRSPIEFVDRFSKTAVQKFRDAAAAIKSTFADTLRLSGSISVSRGISGGAARAVANPGLLQDASFQADMGRRIGMGFIATVALILKGPVLTGLIAAAIFAVFKTGLNIKIADLYNENEFLQSLVSTIKASVMVFENEIKLTLIAVGTLLGSALLIFLRKPILGLAFAAGLTAVVTKGVGAELKRQGDNALDFTNIVMSVFEGILKSISNLFTYIFDGSVAKDPLGLIATVGAIGMLFKTGRAFFGGLLKDFLTIPQAIAKTGFTAMTAASAGKTLSHIEEKLKVTPSRLANNARKDSALFSKSIAALARRTDTLGNPIGEARAREIAKGGNTKGIGTEVLRDIARARSAFKQGEISNTAFKNMAGTMANLGEAEKLAQENKKNADRDAAATREEARGRVTGFTSTMGGIVGGVIGLQIGTQIADSMVNAPSWARLGTILVASGVGQTLLAGITGVIGGFVFDVVSKVTTLTTSFLANAAKFTIDMVGSAAGVAFNFAKLHPYLTAILLGLGALGALFYYFKDNTPEWVTSLLNFEFTWDNLTDTLVGFWDTRFYPGMLKVWDDGFRVLSGLAKVWKDEIFSWGSDAVPATLSNQRRGKRGSGLAELDAGVYRKDLRLTANERWRDEEILFPFDLRTPRFATGGMINGSGTGTSDSIPAMLSHGEFVVNAAATRQNRNLLEKINSGSVPKFAAGGVVDWDENLRNKIRDRAAIDKENLYGEYKYKTSFLDTIFGRPLVKEYSDNYTDGSYNAGENIIRIPSLSTDKDIYDLIARYGTALHEYGHIQDMLPMLRRAADKTSNVNLGIRPESFLQELFRDDLASTRTMKEFNASKIAMERNVFDLPLVDKVLRETLYGESTRSYVSDHFRAASDLIGRGFSFWSAKGMFEDNYSEELFDALDDLHLNKSATASYAKFINANTYEDLLRSLPIPPDTNTINDLVAKNLAAQDDESSIFHHPAWIKEILEEKTKTIVEEKRAKRMASGGLISGPGTGKSDDIPAMLSNGEFVVNARDAQKNRTLLMAINSGIPFKGFSEGSGAFEAGTIRKFLGEFSTDVIENFDMDAVFSKFTASLNKFVDFVSQSDLFGKLKEFGATVSNRIEDIGIDKNSLKYLLKGATPEVTRELLAKRLSAPQFKVGDVSAKDLETVSNKSLNALVDRLSDFDRLGVEATKYDPSSFLGDLALANQDEVAGQIRVLLDQLRAVGEVSGDLFNINIPVSLAEQYALVNKEFESVKISSDEFSKLSGEMRKKLFINAKQISEETSRLNNKDVANASPAEQAEIQRDSIKLQETVRQFAIDAAASLDTVRTPFSLISPTLDRLGVSVEESLFNMLNLEELVDVNKIIEGLETQADTLSRAATDSTITPELRARAQTEYENLDASLRDILATAALRALNDRGKLSNLLNAVGLGINDRTRDLMSDTQRAVLSDQAETIAEIQKELANKGEGPERDALAKTLYNKLNMTEDVIARISAALADDSRQAGLSFEQNVTRGFQDGLGGLLKGELTVKETLTGMLDNFTSTVTNTFLEGFTNNLFGGENGLGKKIAGFGAKIFSSSSTGGGWFSKIFSGIGKAEGGLITGLGTGTSDSIPAMLSNGEYVINAAATKNNMMLLEAINSGKVRRFSKGGLVGTYSGSSASDSRQQQQININITGDISKQTRREIQSMIPEIAAGTRKFNFDRAY